MTVAIAWLFLIWEFDPKNPAIASLQGYSLHIDSPSRATGKVNPRSESTINYKFQNLTNRPIRIQGAEASCSGSVVTNLPRTIEPYCTTDIVAKVNTGSKPENFDGSFLVFTNIEELPAIRLQYSGVVTPGETSTPSLGENPMTQQ